MAGNHIKFSADGKSGSGYIAIPESGTGPAVIVIQEWWGLVGHITDIVDRFAMANATIVKDLAAKTKANYYSI